MMKCIACLVMVFLFFTCSKDKLQSNLSWSNDALESRKSDNNITLCHVNGKGESRAMSVNEHALPIHLSHGDYLPDADGDGFTAICACTGSMDDCDDTDPDVNPGSSLCTDCHCFDLESVCNGDLLFYYNSENNPCGIYDEGEGVFLFYLEGTDTMVVGAGIEEDGRHLVGRSHIVNGVVIYPGNDECIGFVESEDLTLAEYESCLAGLRTIITAHPGLINVCDLDYAPVLEDTNPLLPAKAINK